MWNVKSNVMLKKERGKQAEKAWGCHYKGLWTMM